MNWLSVRVRTDGAPERALAALFAMGSQGVHESDTGLVTHFPGDVDADAIVAAVKAADPGRSSGRRGLVRTTLACSQSCRPGSPTAATRRAP